MLASDNRPYGLADSTADDFAATEAAALAKRLHRGSLRKISEELKAAGFLNEDGRPHHAESVKRMIYG